MSYFLENFDMSSFALSNANKLKIAMYVTWFWALIGLYMVKMMEFIFRMILMIPNSLFEPVNLIETGIRTTNGKKVELINAVNDKGNDVKNKFKVFLKSYYTEASDSSPHDTNGFDFRKLCKLLATNSMTISYMICDDNFSFNIEDIIHYFINFDPNKKESFLYNRIVVDGASINNDIPGVNEQLYKLFLNHVSFDNTDFGGHNDDVDVDCSSGSDSDNALNDIMEMIALRAGLNKED